MASQGPLISGLRPRSLPFAHRGEITPGTNVARIQQAYLARINQTMRENPSIDAMIENFYSSLVLSGQQGGSRYRQYGGVNVENVSDDVSDDVITYKDFRERIKSLAASMLKKAQTTGSDVVESLKQTETVKAILEHFSVKDQIQKANASIAGYIKDANAKSLLKVVFSLFTLARMFGVGPDVWLLIFKLLKLVLATMPSPLALLTEGTVQYIPEALSLTGQALSLTGQVGALYIAKDIAIKSVTKMAPVAQATRARFVSEKERVERFISEKVDALAQGLATRINPPPGQTAAEVGTTLTQVINQTAQQIEAVAAHPSSLPATTASDSNAATVASGNTVDAITNELETTNATNIQNDTLNVAEAVTALLALEVQLPELGPTTPSETVAEGAAQTIAAPPEPSAGTKRKRTGRNTNNASVQPKTKKSKKSTKSKKPSGTTKKRGGKRRITKRKTYRKRV